MNLIYMCVFYKESYITLLKLLITSISLKGNIDKNTTDILIITSQSFQPIIQQALSSFYLPIHYYILDLKRLMDASCCKLKIFTYEQVDRYEKILYLDTDVLVNSDLNMLFNINISSELLYALEEGTIGHEYWGSQFFDFNMFNKNTSAYSAGVFYFMNSDSMKNLFQVTNQHITDYMSTNAHVPTCLDQPFLVYNSFIQKKYDNKMMITYVENNPTTVQSQKIIYHFPGGPGNYERKHPIMCNFLNKIQTSVYKYTIADTILQHKFSMVSKDRLVHLYNECEKFKNTPYSFVECGVAKGGCLALMKSVAPNNKIYGFDSFEGMPEITEEDKGSYNKSDLYNGFGKVGDNLSGGIHNLYKTFDTLKLDMTNVTIVKGFFKDTLNVQENIDVIGEIAILRLDGDWYESTKVCIEKLYDKVIIGGVIIIDDYGHWIGAKRAIDEFREKNNISGILRKTDYTEYYWIKEEKKENINYLNNKILVMMCDNRKLSDTFTHEQYWSNTAYINKNYCNKYGYDFKYITPYYKENTNSIHTSIDINTKELRHATWSKVLLVKVNLIEKYKYVVYIDTHCIFKNFNISIEEVIEKYQDNPFIFQSSYPWNPTLPCSGFFICKNTPDTISILDTWYNYPVPTYTSPEWQATLSMSKITNNYDWTPGKHWEQDMLWLFIANNKLSVTVTTDEVSLVEREGQHIRHVCSANGGERTNYFNRSVNELLQANYPSFDSIIKSIDYEEVDTSLLINLKE